ncbi:MAG: HAD family hydrolase [Anaerolineae bacterium]|nr:HAD family hydrolase [Anaerolineae bacterium]
MTDAIKLIVVDLDGTLLNSQHELSERNEKALKAASEQGVKVILATGKTRASALSVIARLGLETPGIYLQGLAVYAGDGSLRHQSTLDPAIARQVITFAEDRGYTMVAYSGTRMMVRKRDQNSAILVRYGEPEPEVVGPLQNILDDTPINKVLAVSGDDGKRINALRWQLSMQIGGAARLMQAGLPDMLEILPPGASKGAALRTLIKEMNIPASQVMAIGDGENDIEMLQIAGIGVAVGNALKPVQEAANHIVESNDKDGVAEAIERFVLKATEAEEKPDASPEQESETENKSEVET